MDLHTLLVNTSGKRGNKPKSHGKWNRITHTGTHIHKQTLAQQQQFSNALMENAFPFDSQLTVVEIGLKEQGDKKKLIDWLIVLQRRNVRRLLCNSVGQFTEFNYSRDHIVFIAVF